MEMTQETRDYVRSLRASALTPNEVEFLLELMIELDPDCGPKPTTWSGKLNAAKTYVRLMQGAPVETIAFPSAPWRTPHAH